MARAGKWLLPAISLFSIAAIIPLAQTISETSSPAVSIHAVESKTRPSRAYEIKDDGDFDRVDLAPYMECFFDKSKTMNLEEVHASGFFVDAGGRTHWGVQKSTCWFRIPLVSSASRHLFFYASNLVDHARFSIDPGSTLLLYYRLDYDDAGIVCTPTISSESAFQKRMRSSLVFDSVIVGVYVALLLYNLCVALWTRDRAYLVYLHVLACFFLYLLFREFDIRLFGRWDIPSAAFTLPGYLFLLLLAMEYYESPWDRLLSRRLFAMLLALGAITMILYAVSSIGTVFKYVFASLLFCFLGYLTLIMWKERRWKAVFFIVSAGPAIIGMLLMSLVNLGLFSPGRVGPFDLISNQASYFEMAFQMTTLALALGFRIREQEREVVTTRILNERLVERDKMKNRFLISASHELRTPLSVIMGGLGAMRRGRFGAVPADMACILETMWRNGNKLDVRIGNLLAWSRINDAPTTIQFAVRDAITPFASIAEDFVPLATLRNLDYKIEIPPSGSTFPIKYNDDLFETAVLNILSNAFKYTPKEGRITAAIYTDGDGACVVEIKDSGIGIPVEEQQRVFDRYYRGEEGRRSVFDGSGLGLELARNSMDLLGGNIRFKSREGEGTSFFLCFPMVKVGGIVEVGETTGRSRSYIASLGHLTKPCSQAVSAEKIESQRRPRILVVEDDEDLLDLIESEMAVRFDVVTARDGRTALKLLDEVPAPDLVITDLVMPGLDGEGLLDAALEKRPPTLPFIILSALGDEERKAYLLSKGAVDFIAKPFPLDILARKVENLLAWEKAELERERSRIKDAFLSILENGVDHRGDTASIIRLSEYSLSNREKKIVEMVLRGMRDKEIASELGVAVSTISNTLGRIYKKVGVSNRVELLCKLRS